jgi:hypothetical protein
LQKLLKSSPRQSDLGWQGVGFLVIWALAISIMVLEPFGWFDGTPAVHEAKKWIMVCITFIWIPVLAGVWFLIVRPLRTGIAKGGSKYQVPYEVVRSEEPRRFRVEIWCNVLIIILGFAIAVWTLRGFIHDLQKAKTEQSREGAKVEFLKQ